MDNVSRVGGGKYSVVNPINGITINPPSRGWVYGKEDDFWKAVKEGVLEFQDNDKLPILKRYLKDNELQLLDTVFYKDRRGAKIRLRTLLGGEYFDFPKDEEVLSNLIGAFSKDDAIVLDFFSGSGTTAQSVLMQNILDGLHRKFIMVQLPELTSEKSEAYKAGYTNICEIAKERIRRAATKIKEEAGERAKNVDFGFRVLKLDTSNMEEVFYTPEKHVQDPTFFGSLFGNIKEGRTGEDLLFQAMLELDVELSSKIETTTIDGKTVFNIADGYLLACFDENVTDNTIEEIAKLQPSYFVMRDSSMADDSVAVNFEQLFKSYSPSTTLKVL